MMVDEICSMCNGDGRIYHLAHNNQEWDMGNCVACNGKGYIFRYNNEEETKNMDDAKARNESLVQSGKELVSKDPEIMGGVACIAGTRIPVKMIQQMINNHHVTKQELLEDYYWITEEQVDAALAYRE